jgi:hypothetical protein
VSASIDDSRTSQEAARCALLADPLADDRASAVLGGQFTFEQLDSVTDTAKATPDVRPLPDGSICLGTGRDSTGDRVVTVVRLDAGDAPARFAKARAEAQGTATERLGAGPVARSPGSFSKDVQLGDQAFCTTADSSGSSGVFVRRGNVLLYVSLTASAPASDTVSDTANTDDANCELAQKIVPMIE